MNVKKTIFQRIAPYSADVLDPFVQRYKLNYFDKLKVVFMSVTIVPIRIILMLILLVFAWLLGVTTLKGLPEEEKKRQKPLSGWRRKWMKPFIVVLARLVFVVAGWHWIKTKNKRATAKEAPILLLVPHSSFWDSVPVIALGCPGLVVMDSTERTPLIGSLLNYTQPVYVRRDDPTSRQNTIDEILRRCRSNDDWEQILIFPEGGCGNRRALIDFKLGAFYPGVPVQPVFIRYPNRLDTITWTWDGPGTLQQWWFTLCQFHIYCELEFLSVYNPSNFEKENPRIFAENVRKYISRVCNIPISKFSLDDVRYLQLATTQNLPRTVALVKLLKLRRKMGYETVDVDYELKKLTDKQKDMKETSYSLEEFAKYLGTHISEALKDFFYLIDQEKKGTIDVRIYNAGLWLLNKDVNSTVRLEKAFKVFNSEGIITRSQFVAIVLLWKGLPKSVAMDIFRVFDGCVNSKENGLISYQKFVSNQQLL